MTLNNNNNKITLYYAVQICRNKRNLELEEDLKIVLISFRDEDASLEREGWFVKEGLVIP